MKKPDQAKSITFDLNNLNISNQGPNLNSPTASVVYATDLESSVEQDFGEQSKLYHVYQWSLSFTHDEFLGFYTVYFLQSVYNVSVEELYDEEYSNFDLTTCPSKEEYQKLWLCIEKEDKVKSELAKESLLRRGHCYHWAGASKTGKFKNGQDEKKLKKKLIFKLGRMFVEEREVAKENIGAIADMQQGPGDDTDNEESVSGKDSVPTVKIGAARLGYSPVQAKKVKSLLDEFEAGKVLKPPQMNLVERYKNCQGCLVYLNSSQKTCSICCTLTHWYCAGCHNGFCAKPPTEKKKARMIAQGIAPVVALSNVVKGDKHREVANTCFLMKHFGTGNFDASLEM